MNASINFKVFDYFLSRLSSQVNTLLSRVQRTVKYYSSWSHFKELFVIPYRKKPKATAKITLRKSGSKTEVVIDSLSGSRKATGSSGASGGSSGRTAAKQSSGSKLKLGSEKVKQVPPTSPAKEVQDYLFDNVYFTHSKEPRSVRPRNLQFHVGQVVRHKQDNYHGVIVGWDIVAKVTNKSCDYAVWPALVSLLIS